MASAAVGGRFAAGWRWRMRPDLLVYPIRQGNGQRGWGVKDPLSLRYYQLADAEYRILRSLDGQTSLAEVRERFRGEFQPGALGVSELQAFLRTLHSQGLVLAEAPGQAGVLFDRRDRLRRSQRIATWANPLAIRFRGIDPDRLLGWLAVRCGWLLSPWCVAAGGLLMLAALALVVVRCDDVRAHLPSLSALWNAQNLVWLALALAATKILHELAHALACKRFGGECHELGLMLLAFTPCLYCNVSDAWTLARTRQRIAVSAAGIYAECIVAAICTFLWWLSEPGLLHDLCLNVMLVCSVSTLVFNGNPLLRYDGYYILSDLLAMPNLAEQASAALRAMLMHWLLGLELTDRPASRAARIFLPLYAVASAVYRWLVMGVFLWLVFRLFKPLHLESMAYIASTFLVGLLLMPLFAAVRTATSPTVAPFADWRRATFRGGAVLLVLAALLWLPLPYHVTVPALVEAQGARRIYVSMPGKLLSAVAAGTPVKRGDTLVQLENLDIQLEIEKLRGQRDGQQLHVRNLQSRRVSDPQAAALLPTAEQGLKDVEQRLEQRLTDARRLTLAAPTAGIVLPPHARRAAPHPGMLESWSGTPLDPANRKSYLESGTLVCMVGDPLSVEGVLVIDQNEIEFVRVDERVQFAFDELPGVFLEGTIVEVAETDLRVAPAEIASTGQLPATLDAQGVARPRSTSYQARVQLDPHDERVLIGAAGRGKIQLEPRSLAWRLHRYLSRTFRLDL